MNTGWNEQHFCVLFLWWKSVFAGRNQCFEGENMIFSNPRKLNTRWNEQYFRVLFCDEKVCLRVRINVLNAKMIENWILGETNNILWTLLCVFAKFSISENWILKRTNNILSILLCSFRKVSKSFKLIPRWNEQHFISTFVCCLLNLNLLKFDS